MKEQKKLYEEKIRELEDNHFKEILELKEKHKE